MIENFIARSQILALQSNVKGEEGEFFISKIKEMMKLFKVMPKTYEQDGKGKEAIAYLHYFKNGCDWYITERDMYTTQRQAFGLACLNEEYPEIGYISIAELLSVGAELDLYWTPKTIKEIENIFYMVKNSKDYSTLNADHDVLDQCERENRFANQ